MPLLAMVTKRLNGDEATRAMSREMFARWRWPKIERATYPGKVAFRDANTKTPKAAPLQSMIDRSLN